MTTDAAMMLGKGIINSIITGLGGDSLDVITPDDMPEESIEFLRRMLVQRIMIQNAIKIAEQNEFKILD